MRLLLVSLGVCGVGGVVASGLSFLIKANVSVRSSVTILATYFSRLCSVSIRARQTNNELGFCHWVKPLGSAEKLSSWCIKKKKRKKRKSTLRSKVCWNNNTFPPSARPLNVLSVNYWASSGGQHVLIGWPKIHFSDLWGRFFFFFLRLEETASKWGAKRSLIRRSLSIPSSLLFQHFSTSLSESCSPRMKRFEGWQSPNGRIWWRWFFTVQLLGLTTTSQLTCFPSVGDKLEKFQRGRVKWSEVKGPATVYGLITVRKPPCPPPSLPHPLFPEQGTTMGGVNEGLGGGAVSPVRVDPKMAL